jgi:DNA-binding winged helix-turn-helix (wHTH) protein/TolB-like protein/Tfp pilus assembly protein PilF
MSGGEKSFAGFDLNAERKVLRRGGEIVPLPPKAIELLIVLLNNRGEVVSKDELLDTVWKETFVEESVLSNNIYILRKTLSELGAGKNLIQTVPRRGYRFVADLGEPDDEAEIVVERHVFRQTLIEEILGELESRAPINAFNRENPEQSKNALRENPERLIDELPFRQSNLSATPTRKSPESISSIAVLPFVNESGDADLDYLSDGISESLIDNLSLLPRLRVIARTTVFRYKSLAGEISPRQIGEELDVEAIVSGRILLFKDSLTIKIEIVRTTDAAQLWGDRYCHKFDDVLEMQTEIAHEISGKLRLILNRTEVKHFPRRETVNPEAYNFYLKGRYFWNKRTAEWMKKGIECFQQALDCDPNYALAYSGVADSYISLVTVGALSPASAIPKAKAAAQKALEINDRVAEAHAALGFIKNSYDWDFQASDTNFKLAAETNPNYSIAYHWHGFCLMLRKQFAESIELMKQAQILDPLSPIINIACGLPFYYMRRYDRAIEIYREVLETDAMFFPGYAYLCKAYEQNHQFEDALMTVRQALVYAPNNTFALTSLAHIYAVSGNEEKAWEIVEQLKTDSSKRYITPYGLAEIYAGLKEKELALTHLEKAAAERSWWLVSADVNPRFDGLRNEPRFLKILQKMNLG